MTGCLCIHHQYKTCGFKQRQTGRLQSADWRKVTAVCGPTIFVWDDWGVNRMESPSPSLLNTVYSEAGWFGVIFPVISQTITPLGCDALPSSAHVL